MSDNKKMNLSDLYDILQNASKKDLLLALMLFVGSIVLFIIADWRIGVIGIISFVFSVVNLVIHAKLHFHSDEHHIITAICKDISRAEFGSFTSSKWYEFESVGSDSNIRLQISGMSIKKDRKYCLAFKGDGYELSNQTLLYIEPISGNRNNKK